MLHGPISSMNPIRVAAISMLSSCRPLAWLALAVALVAAPAQPQNAPQSGQEALYVVTHVDVLPAYAAETVRLLGQFASDSRRDPGAQRFEVLQELSRGNHFTLVEAWQNRQAYEDHLAAAHSKQFRDKLQPMLGSPFDERLHHLVP
jgi:quinol monooxygenase YgiN